MYSLPILHTHVDSLGSFSCYNRDPHGFEVPEDNLGVGCDPPFQPQGGTLSVVILSIGCLA
jgi:hypothetical protein